MQKVHTSAPPQERAAALIPILDAAAPRIEAERKMPSDVLEAMHNAGIFRVLLPKSVGGAEEQPLQRVCSCCFGQKRTTTRATRIPRATSTKRVAAVCQTLSPPSAVTTTVMAMAPKRNALG